MVPSKNPAAERRSRLTSKPRINTPTTPENAHVGTEVPPPASPMHLHHDEIERPRDDDPFAPYWHTRGPEYSSTHPSVSEQRVASSGLSAQGASECHTTSTMASNIAESASINNSTADDDDGQSATRSVDPFYSGFSIVLGANLAQDLQSVEVDEQLLGTLLEEFSLRSRNNNTSKDHLRLMDMVYRCSRYERLPGTTIRISES